MSKRIYIAGGMRGIPLFNFPAFDEAAARGRALGYFVISPAEMDREKGFDETRGTLDGFDIRDAISRDVAAILDCTAIALLPGWRNSIGATTELAVAKWAGLEVLDATTFLPFDETAVQEAQRICYGDRNQDYGHPFDECERIAKFWSIILGVEVKTVSVPLCMVALKISREMFKDKFDNWVDICGYAECGHRVVTEAARRATHSR